MFGNTGTGIQGTDVREARIRLAEAMGWTRFDSFVRRIPDPFTDANDDVAVLEWVKKNEDALTIVQFSDVLDEMRSKPLKFAKYGYEIGDYARAGSKDLNISVIEVS